MNRKELAATSVCLLDIVEGGWLYKSRSGGPADAAASDALDHPSWAGLVPVRTGYGPPQPAPWVDQPMPESVRRLLDGDAESGVKAPGNQ